MEVDIGEELTRLVHSLQPYSHREPVDRAAWSLFLDSYPLDSTVELHHHLCAGSPDRPPWRWTWEDGVISIEFDRPTSVNATQTSITSPLLRGDWWAQIDDRKLEVNDTGMRMTGRCEHIPILIRGGDDIDPHSMFFLGMLAFRLGSLDFFTQWLSEAAAAGEPNAQQILGRYLMGQSCTEEAVYWLARSTLEHNDIRSITGLCSLLWNSKPSLANPLLAEALLKPLARDGNPEAALELGCIYLKGAPGVPAQLAEARRLLRLAARAGNGEAKGILANISPGSEKWTGVAPATAGVAAAAVARFYLARRIYRFRK